MSTTDRAVHLRRARDLIDLRFAEPLDLVAMAREASFSRYNFARSFNDTFGETPGAYRSRRRVERAKDLLRSANLTVTEVCMVVGFSSLGSFSSRFTEIVGETPSAYRSREHPAVTAMPPCVAKVRTRPTRNSASRNGEAARGAAA